jgi:hypothetical protein
MKNEFDPKTFHLAFAVDKVTMDRIYSEKFEFPCKCFLNIHETETSAVNIIIFLCVYKEISDNPNTNKLQTKTPTQITTFWAKLLNIQFPLIFHPQNLIFWK